MRAVRTNDRRGGHVAHARHPDATGLYLGGDALAELDERELFSPWRSRHAKDHVNHPCDPVGRSKSPFFPES
jgi:hypothetical protein